MISLLLAFALAQPAPATTDKVLLTTQAYVGRTAKIGAMSVPLPNEITLEAGTYEARIVTATGQVVVKRFTVGEPSEHARVVDLDDAPPASVPGHRFRLEAKAAEGHVVFVDGAEAGPSPVVVLLAPGKHQIEVVGPDGNRVPHTLELKAGEGEQTTVSF